MSFIFGYKFWKSLIISSLIRKQSLISIVPKLGVSLGIFKNVFGLIRLEPLIVSLFKLGHSARSTSRFLLLSIRDPLFSKLSHCKLGQALHTSEMYTSGSIFISPINFRPSTCEHASDFVSLLNVFVNLIPEMFVRTIFFHISLLAL